MNPELTNATLTTVGWVAIHSLWQGLLVTGALMLVRRVLYYRPPRLRYVVGFASLGLMAVLAVGTAAFVLLRPEPVPAVGEVVPSVARPTAVAAALPSAGPADVPAGPALHVKLPPLPPLTPADRLILAVDPWIPSLPIMVTCWCVGVGLIVILQAIGILLASRIVRASTPVGPAMAARCQRLCQSLNAPSKTQFLTTSHQRIRSPLTLGWRRPIVIVPVHVVAHLPEPAVDALVAHELAHVRRADYVANAFQIGIEAFLFFNPCVWWISGVIRNEREMCCDTEVLKAEFGEKTYANALAALAGIAPPAPVPRHFLSAMGGAFLERIQAIAGTRAAGSRLASAVLSGCLVCSSAVGAAAISKTVELRDLSFAGRTHESVMVFEELRVPRHDHGFAVALVDALRAVKTRSFDPTQADVLAATFAEGADPNVIWRDFQHLRRPGYYPTTSSEFPPDWRWGEAGTQRHLARVMWRQAKQMPDGPRRRLVGRTALGIAAMRRESTSMAAVNQIVTDVQFADVCGFSPDVADRLRKYASASSTLIGRAVVALRREAEGGEQSTLSKTLRFDRQAMDLCRPRLPELDFADQELRRQSLTTAGDHNAIVQTLFMRPGPP